MRRLRDAALAMADRGWSVVPLKPGQKQPATRHGLHDACDDLVGVFKHWQAIPEANVGVVCHASDLVVLDVDPRHGGDETLYEAEQKLGKLPTTVSALTGGGGAHYFFNHPGGTMRGQLGPGLDVKDRGYVLVSPSIHPSGQAYEWDNEPSEVEVADLPEKWVDAIRVSYGTVLTRTFTDSIHDDPIRNLPAIEYIKTISGVQADHRGWFCCPWHDDKDPSAHAEGTKWCCYVCEPMRGKQKFGGNIYDWMTLALQFPVPARGVDYLVVKDHLRKLFPDAGV